MKHVIIFTVLFVSSFSAIAADSSDLYISASYNHFSIDFKNADVDDSDGFGVLFGIDFPSNLAFEAEYIDSGKADMDYKVGAIESAKIRIQSLATYGVFRTSGDIYFKARAGLVVNLVDITSIQCSGSLCVNSLYDDDAGLAFGIGGGATLTEAMKLEFEYKILNQDFDVLGASLVYSF